jgi:hypothetical protein
MEPLLLDVLEPQQPFFEVWVDNQKMADLIEPAWVEMFWCSYKLIPVDAECNQRLRKYELWNECKFEIRHPASGHIAGISLAGGWSFQEYCKSQTERIDFRSLWPPKERFKNGPSIVGRLLYWLRSFWTRNRRDIIGQDHRT